ncbi:hypothetical protein BH11BAC3_BH11BAC3_29870 [soil metagenome]
MRNFTVPTREQVGETQRSFYNGQKDLGFVLNLYATIAYSDKGLGKYLAYQNAKSYLNNKEKKQ